MTALERLKSIKQNQNYIEQLQKRRNTLTSFGVQAVNYAAPRVQKSYDASSTEKVVERHIERLQAINNRIADLLLENENILDEMHECDGGIYSEVLYMRYAEGMTVKEISNKLGYEYGYTSTMHSKALKLYESYLNQKQ